MIINIKLHVEDGHVDVDGDELIDANGLDSIEEADTDAKVEAATDVVQDIFENADLGELEELLNGQISSIEVVDVEFDEDEEIQVSDPTDDE